MWRAAASVVQRAVRDGEARSRHPVALSDLPDDPRGDAGGDDPGWEVARDDGPGADDGVVADGHAWTDDRAPSEPDVVADRDRLGGLPAEPARLRVDRVGGGEKLDARRELARGADPDGRDIEQHAVVVDERPRADRYVAAVVAEEGRPDDDALAHLADQLAQQPVAELLLVVPGRVVALRSSRARACSAGDHRVVCEVQLAARASVASSRDMAHPNLPRDCDRRRSRAHSVDETDERRRMKLGIGLPNTMAHETDRALMLDWARLAEDAGFDLLATIDNPNYDAWDPLVTLAGSRV